ncbi:golgin subfamily A member 6-like protein 22 [Anopheles aquasalis]|uniref:golgin subfamily A member 6-like protein 22 n=1 Tax=Anopheles aquasalis TaxID=42839 RepID=UPI00215A83F8|nr:golgin subfamily A member 6-like protein 22 [Anopheles aquasalis]
MKSGGSNASFSRKNAADMLGAIIDRLPEGGMPNPTVRRLAKLKQQLNRQNNSIAELKRKIREKDAMKPKADCDREELIFLKNRLQKEVEIQHKLLDLVVQEQRKEGTSARDWETIRLCPDKLDEQSCNPWTLGRESVEQRGFSFDSNLSPMSSLELGGTGTGIVDADVCGKLTERMEKELMNRDRVIQILQSRLEQLIVDVRKVKQQGGVSGCNAVPVNPRFCEADLVRRLEFYRNNTETLGKNLQQMDNALKTIQKELGTVEDDSQEPQAAGRSTSVANTTGTSRPVRESANISSTDWKTLCDERSSNAATVGPNFCTKELEVQKQYKLLLQEYTRKAAECQQLSDRLVIAGTAKEGAQDQSQECAERELLKKRCSELLDEQDEFRVLIREQSVQLEDYRAKFLAAQQKVEEQKLQMDKQKTTERRIEQQINFEIQQIKKKFHSQLRELTPYPRLLEDEEAKVEKLKHSNQKLYGELERTLQQVKLLEERLHAAESSKREEVQKAVEQLQLELEHLRQRQETAQKDKQAAEEEAVRKQLELDELRTESAKIIARTNQRLEQERQAAQERYGQLETELAQCRAEASFNISNREEALREMHHQIKVLSGSFDDAQLQIQSLRNQLAYLQNEKLLCLE